MQELDDAVNAAAFEWMCKRLKISRDMLEVALAERNSYRRAFISKRGQKDKAKGRKRVLHIPPGTRKNPGPLRIVQRRIHDWLLKTVRWPGWVHGFVEGRSHLTANRRHATPASEAFLEIDFKNAFDSVTSKAVFGALVSRLRLEQRVAHWLTELVTHNGRLPQGAASSPLVFNLVVWNLDEVLVQHARAKKYTYTRYSDSVVFSAPQIIPRQEQEEIAELCRQAGFRIPPEKIRYQERRWRMPELNSVLIRRGGLGLSNRRVVDQVRAMLHRAVANPTISAQKLQGKLGWVKTVDPAKLKTRLGKPLRKLWNLGIIKNPFR